MKTFIKKLAKEMTRKQTILAGFAIVAFLLVSGFAFNALVNNTFADDFNKQGCFPRADIEEGNIRFDKSGIARAFVKNIADESDRDCTYDVSLSSYEVFVPQSHPDFLSTQVHFDSHTVTLAPGESTWLEASLPQCAYQVDLYLGGEEINPENITPGELLKFHLNTELPFCEDEPPPPPPPPADECPADLEVPSLTSPTEVRGLTVGSEINYQIEFEGDRRGNTKVVDVRGFPNWWPDIRWDQSTNRVVGTIPQGATAGQFSFTVFFETTVNGELCEENSERVTIFWDVPSDQCPADFEEPTITGANTINAEPGDNINYLFGVFGDGTKTVNVSGLPSWLFFNSNTNRITGTVPVGFTGTESFTINVSARDTETDLVCKTASKTVVINVDSEQDQCPADFEGPVITGANTINAVPGQAIDYDFSVSGDGDINTNVLSLPSWLAYNEANTRITGTVPADFAGSEGFTISSIGTDRETGLVCRQVTKEVTINVTGPECPADFVLPIITGDSDVVVNVGDQVNYSFSVSGSGSKTITVSGLPSWLSLDEDTKTITGTMRDETVNFTIDVVAKDADGDVCGVDTLDVQIRPRTVTGQCPADFEDVEITSPRDIKSRAGRDINYLITFTGDGDIEITVSDLPSWLSFDEDTNRVTGTMPDNENHSFVITAESRDGEELCSVDSIRVTISGQIRTGRCINCDDDDEPNVRVSSISDFDRPEGEVAGRFVRLAEVPVTGVAGSAQSILFTIGLMMISAGISYVLMSGRMRDKIVNAFASAGSYRKAIAHSNSRYDRYDSSEDDDDSSSGGGFASTAFAPTNPFVGGGGYSDAMTKERQEKINERYNEITSSRNITVDGDDRFPIAKELGALARKEAKRSSGDEASLQNALSGDTSKLEARIEERAREHKTLLSDEGIKLLVKASEGKEENATSILSEMVKVADEWYVREDGWLLLNQKRIQEVLFATYVMMVPSFVSWIAEGNEDKAFGFINMLQSQGHSVKEFMKNVVYELDALYRYRKTGENTDVSNETLRIAGRWNLETVEEVVESFIGAIDSSYKNDHTPVKLAVLKAITLANQGRA